MTVEFRDLTRAAQAGIRCNDVDFQKWLNVPAKLCGLREGKISAADIVRGRCGVESRADLTTDEDAGTIWDAMLDEFEARKNF